MKSKVFLILGAIGLFSLFVWIFTISKKYFLKDYPLYMSKRIELITKIKRDRAINYGITAKFEIDCQNALLQSLSTDNIPDFIENPVFSALYRRYDNQKKKPFFELHMAFIDVMYGNNVPKRYKAKISSNGSILEIIGPYTCPKHPWIDETEISSINNIKDRVDDFEKMKISVPDFNKFNISEDDLAGWDTLDVPMHDGC